MSHTKSDHQTQEWRHSGPKSHLNLGPHLTLKNHLTDDKFVKKEKKSAQPLLEGGGRSSSRGLINNKHGSFDIKGVQNAVQFNLKIEEHNFSHRSKSVSSKSAASMVYDLISQ